MTTAKDKRWGANPEDWDLFSDKLGLTEDLLPAVCNPAAVISPLSKMKKVGKTPSFYNGFGQATGFGDWTNHRATERNVAAWKKTSDYGICLIGRNIKAIDCDITDTELSPEVHTFIRRFLYVNFDVVLPLRRREGSPKFLVAFACPEFVTKRVITTEHGIIEFLGDRQQFLVAGTHESGSRYEWRWPHSLCCYPDELSLAQFDQLWNALQAEFGVAPAITSKARKTITVDTEEPILKALTEKDLIISEGRNGEYNVICPFAGEHTTESADSATVYWPPHTGGYAHASLKCLHAHCAGRTTEDFKEVLGISVLDDFDDISGEVFEPPTKPAKKEKKGNPLRYLLQPAVPFATSGGKPLWLMKELIPMSAIGYIYGPSGGGKTFLTFDIACAIARGIPWRGHKTKQGLVVYICAEGAYFFRNRIRAYLVKNKLDKLDIVVLDGRPDLLKAQDVADLIAACAALDVPVAAVIIDTYASCMTGDENSAQDVTKVLNSCNVIKSALDTTVVLVHHSGKDISRGARGNSSLRAGVEFEYLVTKTGNLHTFLNQKQKDGKDGFEYHFKLEEIELELDDDLEPITSCVIEHTDEKPQGPDGKPAGVREVALYDGLSDYYNDNEVWPSIDALIAYVNGNTGHAKADLKRSIRKMVDKMVLRLTGDIVTFHSADVDEDDFSGLIA